MNSKAAVIVLLAFASAFSRMASAEVSTSDDSSTGDHTVTHQSNFGLDSSENELSPSTFLANKIFRGDGRVEYTLVITTNSARVAGEAGYRPVPEDRAVWRIDGQATQLGSAVANRSVQGAFVQAVFYVSLDQQAFEKLANAGTVVLEVGEAKYTLSSDAIAEIKEVAESTRP